MVFKKYQFYQVQVGTPTKSVRLLPNRGVTLGIVGPAGRVQLVQMLEHVNICTNMYVRIHMYIQYSANSSTSAVLVQALGLVQVLILQVPTHVVAQISLRASGTLP